MNTETETLKTQRTDLQQVDPRNLVVEQDFNVRKDYGDLVGLAHSVVKMGVIEPLVGYKILKQDRFVMTDGHRRLAAVMLAIQFHQEGKPGFEDISKIERIPLRSASSDIKERLYIMAITGERKKPLTDIEKAEMYNRLIELGKKEGKKRGEIIDDIVQRLGVSQATVYNTLSIVNLPEPIKAAIANNLISGGTVVSIVREVKDEAEQVRLVNEAIESAKSVEKDGKKGKATAAHVKGLKAKSPMQRLKEVAEKLESKEVKNSRTKLLTELLEALDERRSVNKILELFI